MKASFPRSIVASGRAARRWIGEERGVSAAEFALVLPLLLHIFLGGFQISQALSTYRKLVDTTVQLSSVISQNQQAVTNSQLTAQVAAAALIMNPYATAPLTVTVSEIETAPSTVTAPFTTACSAAPCPALVLWKVTCTGFAGSGGPTCAVATVSTTASTSLLPTDLGQPGAGYTLVQASYLYKTSLGAKYIGAQIPMASQLYMSPREQTVITCADC